MTPKRSPLMPRSEALARMLATMRGLGAEEIGLAAASGRILAQDVRARLTQPPFAASAMDGYALRRADLATTPARFAVIGEAPAGMPFAGGVRPGEAVRIFTGGALPEGADVVVIQEDTRRDGDVLLIEKSEAETHIRAAGADFHAGDVLLKRGRRIDGLGLALIAAGNADRVSVFRRPRLAIVATGDELVPAGSAVAPGRIVNSIAPGLAALAQDWGAQVVHVGHARDDEAAIRAELDAALHAGMAADIVVLIGGASVGDYDLVKPALAARGLEFDFEKAALKPGKPIWAGRIGGAHILGLPGNPVSAFVCAHLFLKPALFAMTGRDGASAATLIPATLDGKVGANGPRESFLNAAMRLIDGRLFTQPLSVQDSGLLLPLSMVGCLLNRPAGAPAAADGAAVCILPLHRELPDAAGFQI